MWVLLLSPLASTAAWAQMGPDFQARAHIGAKGPYILWKIKEIYIYIYIYFLRTTNDFIRRRKEQENLFRKDFSSWTACMAQMNLHRPYGRRKEGRAPWLTLTLHCQCFADTTTHRRTWIGHYVEEHNCQEIQNAKVCPTGIFKKAPSDANCPLLKAGGPGTHSN